MVSGLEPQGQRQQVRNAAACSPREHLARKRKHTCAQGHSQPTVEAGNHSVSMRESCQSLKGCRVTETARKTAVVMAVSIFCSWRRLSPSDSKAACPTQSLRDASDRKKSARGCVQEAPRAGTA
jgi:hypothetical protein